MTTPEAKKPIGALLKEKGLITEEHIQFALKNQKISGERLGEILEHLCFVTQYDVAVSLSEQENIPYIDVDAVLPEKNVLRLFNKNLCLNNQFLPLRIENKTMEVATPAVTNEKVGQLISRQTGFQPKFFISESGKIINAINKSYYFIDNPVEKLVETEVNLLSHDPEMARGMDNLIKHILHLAVKMRATDIHIRPMEKSINIALRVDGVMTSALALPLPFRRMIASIKMKADMDIAEQRMPQDGRFSANILNNDYDFRASTIVSPYGENIVLRILPMQAALMGMTQLGFFEEDIERVENIFQEPFGIILLTGPTGSGKSTTLYAGIRRLDLLRKNVLTVEDPIEFSIPLLRQTQVNEKAGYTFANAIRYFLRHDPDVILVGEIRDVDTAATAITASTTGHLVLSTLHTNSAIGAIPRLRDLQIRPFLIADSLRGVISQRLVRKICNGCREAYRPEEWERAYLRDPSIETLHRGRGCEICNGSGYFGRTLVYELLVINKNISRLIEKEAEVSDIISQARADNEYVDIFHTTAAKVKEGITTVEEAIRVLGHLT
ncbi:MAG: Flp pilus assembly complex ATPase component TadA [Deltaproteobacteria bacterium]|nr:Flp pilus assembly complex ATPase component TadA [Deltaproteobacteria bacterium]